MSGLRLYLGINPAIKSIRYVEKPVGHDEQYPAHFASQEGENVHAHDYKYYFQNSKQRTLSRVDRRKHSKKKTLVKEERLYNSNNSIVGELQSSDVHIDHNKGNGENEYESKESTNPPSPTSRKSQNLGIHRKSVLFFKAAAAVVGRKGETNVQETIPNNVDRSTLSRWEILTGNNPIHGASAVQEYNTDHVSKSLAKYLLDPGSVVRKPEKLIAKKQADSIYNDPNVLMSMVKRSAQRDSNDLVDVSWPPPPVPLRYIHSPTSIDDEMIVDNVLEKSRGNKKLRRHSMAEIIHRPSKSSRKLNKMLHREKDDEELRTSIFNLSVRDMKFLIRKEGLTYADCIEKDELRERAYQALVLSEVTAEPEKRKKIIYKTKKHLKPIFIQKKKKKRTFWLVSSLDRKRKTRRRGSSGEIKVRVKGCPSKERRRSSLSSTSSVEEMYVNTQEVMKQKRLDANKPRFQVELSVPYVIIPPPEPMLIPKEGSKCEKDMQELECLHMYINDMEATTIRMQQEKVEILDSITELKTIIHKIKEEGDNCVVECDVHSEDDTNMPMLDSSAPLLSVTSGIIYEVERF